MSPRSEAVNWAALHVDFRSDLLELGPLPDRAQAVNLMEAVLAGAREVLDMGDAELEGFVEERGEGDDWVLIYDPMPGGSGFLQQVRERWQKVCVRAQEIMEAGFLSATSGIAVSLPVEDHLFRG